MIVEFDEERDGFVGVDGVLADASDPRVSVFDMPIIRRVLEYFRAVA